MTKKVHNRLERFLQLKRGIRGSKAHLLVGIDVAKGKHHAFFGTATGKTLLKRLIFDNSREGFERLLSEVRRQKESAWFEERGVWIGTHGQLSQAFGGVFNQGGTGSGVGGDGGSEA